jgi:hypothetical protein
LYRTGSTSGSGEPSDVLIAPFQRRAKQLGLTSQPRVAAALKRLETEGTRKKYALPDAQFIDAHIKALTTPGQIRATDHRSWAYSVCNQAAVLG